jgi:restriction endonuclease S subunit
MLLGDLLPGPLTKGPQPRYLETLEPEGIPVISTLAIQRLTILPEKCRYISEADFELIDEERRPHASDVLLTMDGGPSIGKPALFELEDDYAVDSHVAMLRLEGIKPIHLVYLLASPLGQLQFKRAESGASGQTAVTEDDLRRFRFPVLPEETLDELVDALEAKRQQIEQTRAELNSSEQAAWSEFNAALMLPT